jgi:hypothetical protein
LLHLQRLLKRFIQDVSNDWMESYEKQAVALKGFLGKNKGYEYSRDEKMGSWSL